MAGLISKEDYQGMVKEQSIDRSIRTSVADLEDVTAKIYNKIFETDREETTQGDMPQTGDVITDTINIIEDITSRLSKVLNSLHRL